MPKMAMGVKMTPSQKYLNSLSSGMTLSAAVAFMALPILLQGCLFSPLSDVREGGERALLLSPERGKGEVGKKVQQKKIPFSSALFGEFAAIWSTFQLFLLPQPLFNDFFRAGNSPENRKKGSWRNECIPRHVLELDFVQLTNLMVSAMKPWMSGLSTRT